MSAYCTLAISFWPYIIPFSHPGAGPSPHASLAFMYWLAGVIVLPLMLIYPHTNSAFKPLSIEPVSSFPGNGTFFALRQKANTAVGVETPSPRDFRVMRKTANPGIFAQRRENLLYRGVYG